MKIKKILIEDAVPGMVVADDIYTFSNQLIIARNTSLTDKIITRLKFYAVQELPIVLQEAKKPVTEVEDDFKEQETYSQRVKKTPEFKRYKKTFLKTAAEFKGLLNSVASQKAKVNIHQLLDAAHTILHESRNNLHLFDLIHNMRNYDDQTYMHSINVSLICTVIGRWLNLPEEEIEILSLCGLLHDIGKLEIPQSIISKPAKLTDEEYKTVKTHTVRGYQILKGQDIDKRIKYTALMHHELCDGSGYPNGFTRRHIDDFACITTIADVYDAMTSARVYRGPLCPFEVIELFENEGYSKYDPLYLLTFLKGITQTYINTNVLLSNDLEGEIVMLNNNAYSKPVVKVKNNFIDLSKHHEIKIVSLL